MTVAQSRRSRSSWSRGREEKCMWNPQYQERPWGVGDWRLCLTPHSLHCPRGSPPGKPSRSLTSWDWGYLSEWLGERVLAGVVFPGPGVSWSLPSPESGPGTHGFCHWEEVIWGHRCTREYCAGHYCWSMNNFFLFPFALPIRGAVCPSLPGRVWRGGGQEKKSLPGFGFQKLSS